MHRSAGIVLALSLCLGCGKSPTQPGTSPSTTPGPSGAPVAKLQIKVDEGMSRDAIASMSDVTVDATSSTGTGALTFSIDFGDGTVATSTTAHHTYATAGTFTIAATVTDAQGRKTTDSSAIIVKAVTGRWFQAEYVARARRIEVRQMSIDAQDGLQIRGVYRSTGSADRPFTATLTPPRQIQIAIAGGAGLSGLLPDHLNDATTPWTLLAQGDSVDGERLDFRIVIGDTAGEPPVADMTLRFGSDGAYAPIAGITPVDVDGTASRGTNLLYFIEFGDGAIATTSQASRVVDVKTGPLTARLTVVDQFGRSDSRSRQYYLVTLTTGSMDDWFTGLLPDGARLYFTFGERSGTKYSASFTRPRPYPQSDYLGRGTAVLSGDGDVRVTIPASGIEFVGKLAVQTSASGQTRLILIQHGGPDDGRTWHLYYYAY